MVLVARGGHRKAREPAKRAVRDRRAKLVPTEAQRAQRGHAGERRKCGEPAEAKVEALEVGQHPAPRTVVAYGRRR